MDGRIAQGRLLRSSKSIPALCLSAVCENHSAKPFRCLRRARICAMKPQLAPNTYNVSAYCPDCRVVTAFGQGSSVVVNSSHTYAGKTYARVLYIHCACSRCGRAGLATIPDDGNPQSAVLESFFPISVDAAPLPKDVPPDIQAEFREAENCAAFGANRAASTLFRSVLEKTLKGNGYVKGIDPTLKDLQKRIDAAGADGIITDARRKRAHDEIRSLGNDVLHDDWRVVDDAEVEEAHRYMQRILEDFYDDRPTVEAILKSKGKLP
jgi:Domain of unknown function (DUF4145)